MSRECVRRWRILSLALVGVLSFSSGSAYPQEGWQGVLGKKLNQMLSASGIPKKEFGIWVLDEHSGKLILGLNENQSMEPASLSKLATAGASLTQFPPGHQFETWLLSDGTVKDGVLDGDLYLKGGGDPSFVSEKMWFLVNEFIRTDIKQIKGDLVVDDSLFDQERFDEDRDSVRVDRAYDAPVGAMSFNWNSINIYVRPGEKVGDPARVKMDPINSYIELQAQAKTSKAGSGKSLEVSRSSTAKGDRIVVKGSLGVDMSEVVIYKSITKPDLWAASNCLEFLRQRGILVTGQIRKGRTPSAAKGLAKAPSVPIGQSVTDMMKFSNNYVAEMLTKNMAVGAGQAQGTMKGGIEQIRKFLDKVGLSRDSYKFVNPSGLTPDNRISPAALGKLLEYMRAQFEVFPEFLSSLPIAGVDGTLKRRLDGTLAEGMVRAKTGLLKQGGVVGLSGYAKRRGGGETIAFVFLLNNGKSVTDVDRVWRLFDSLAMELVR